MAAPDITLTPGNLLATQSSSVLGLEVQTDGYLFASVALVYETSEKTTVGQSVLFKQSDAVVIKYGSTIYYQLNEAAVIFTEVSPPVV